MFNKLLPSKGLAHICAYVALWRLQLAGLEPCSLPFLGTRRVDALVETASDSLAGGYRWSFSRKSVWRGGTLLGNSPFS